MGEIRVLSRAVAKGPDVTGQQLLEALRRLCRDLDLGRRPRRLTRRGVVLPIALPAVFGLALVVAGCERENDGGDCACEDQIDNDLDGLVDCEDPDCEWYWSCSELLYGVPFEDPCSDWP